MHILLGGVVLRGPSCRGRAGCVCDLDAVFVTGGRDSLDSAGATATSDFE